MFSHNDCRLFDAPLRFDGDYIVIYISRHGVAEATCIVATASDGRLSVCLSVPRCIPTLLHGPGCRLTVGMVGGAL